MKIIRYWQLILLPLIPLKLTAQTGLGTSNPHTSSILDIQSNSRGVLIPRMTAAQRDAIVSPAEGLEVFVTDLTAKFFFDGANWVKTNKELFSTNTQIYGCIPVSTGVGASSQGQKQVATFFLSAKSIDADFADRQDAKTIKILKTGTYVIELTNVFSRVASPYTPIAGRMIIQKNGAFLKDSFAAMGIGPSSSLNSTSMGTSFVATLVQNDLITLWYEKVGTGDNLNVGFNNIYLTIRK